MQGTRKCVESRQLHNEDYLQEERVEPGSIAGVPSISSMPEEGRNDGDEYTSELLEDILHRDNLNLAYKRVKDNKGSHGIDGMTVNELLQFLKENGAQLRQSILEGTYTPQPVRRVEIPKPDGGKRLLGIPTVVDRVIQQAIAQVLTPIYEMQFSVNSYGFRPGRDAKQAIRRCKEYIEAGYTWAVDIDLAKYFDTVNHDKLMRLLSVTIEDNRVLSLIRKYLQSGIMVNGVVAETEAGVPQGGNLSPLLSNVMLNELDIELTKRGLSFCRYADDANIYVRSEKAAKRVMASVTRFLEEELKLKVNKEKSAVNRPWKLKFLGFSFYPKKGGMGIRVHPKPVKKFKQKLKEITGRSNAMSVEERREKLRQCIVGWVNYFGMADMKATAKALDEWLRRRIRMCYWKQWKKISAKRDNLVKLGMDERTARKYANTRKSYWHTANSPILTRILTNERLRKIGFITVSERYSITHSSC
ncbi:group II intron reverse transcriptase/maturase [Sporomusa sphaeroides]|uniref:Group II intron-encoded protein LtrA n=1 Tax=Sporomusa sphaeroides DSM 2875 TaxID=1337886 RepID=A0ABP2C621_9FIRM|nr:group II intron reverse transcriptase/maturase [Sporomusa sphaeroides]OLS55803.1 group II intron-encoded protein LtrA [Sporomusa sphaeroides DSM 2875]CVK18804.1 Group II intron-encoded protein LtrA [Sporomusa sphaeroides DSM 2875]